MAPLAASRPRRTPGLEPLSGTGTNWHSSKLRLRASPSGRPRGADNQTPHPGPARAGNARWGGAIAGSSPVDSRYPLDDFAPVKLLWAFLLILSLASGPVAAHTVPVAACTMTGDEMAEADMMGDATGSDHDKMPCCSPDCATTSPAAVLPRASTGPTATQPPSSPIVHAAVDGLTSALLPTDDPPPRACA